MSIESIRLSSMLTFDTEQEKDIIQLVDALNSSHRTGQFLSNLIRLAVDNPELLEVHGGRYKSKNIALDYIEKVGMSNNRKVFMDKLKNESVSLKEKVDTIYNMTMKLMVLAQMNKYLELDNKSKNIMSANFILEKQVKELQDLLGIGNSIFESNKIQDTEKRAEEALEFIIETYDGIVKEFKQSIQTQPVVQQPVVQQPVVQQSVVQQPVVQQPVVQPEQIQQELTQTNDDTEVVDFGNADTSALLRFFGDS